MTRRRTTILTTPRIVAPRFATLLFVLLTLIVVLPVVLARLPGVVLELGFDAVLIVGVFSAGGAGRNKIPLAVLTLLTLGSRWVDVTQGSVSFSIVSTILTVLWIGYTVAIIMHALLLEADVTGNTIFGAMVVYLLAALGFAVVYGLILQLSPEAISGLQHAGDPDRVFGELVYFSIISITTMGYGDIVPVSDFARSLAALEGAFGQIYLVVMIARLVGLHIAADRD